MYGPKSNNPLLSMNTLTIAKTYPRGLHGHRGGRGLGDTAVVLANGARVSGPSPAPLNYRRSNGSAALSSGVVQRPAPGVRFPVSQAYNQPGGNNGGMNLAQLQQLAQTNPASLTPQQFALLQSAGTIPSTLPYASASALATPATTAVDTTALATTSGFDLSATYSGLPLWGWLLIGGGGLYLMTKRGR